MPIWALALLKIILPLLLQALVKAGVFTQLQADMIVGYEDFITALKNLKTYSAPEDFPLQNARGQTNVAAEPVAETNINKP